MAGLGWNKYAYGKDAHSIREVEISGLGRRNFTCGSNSKNYYQNKMRLCKACGKQAVKGKYCQSCADFIRKMQKRDPA